MNSNNIMEVLAARRTIRRYSDEPLAEGELNSLIDAAFYAPTYLDRRPYHFVVVQDKPTQESLGAILGVRPYIQQAGAVFVLLGDPELSNSWEIDLAAVAENILIAATGLGLGAAWVGNSRGAAWEQRVAEIRELLAIPDNLGLLGLVTVGRPAETKAPHSHKEWNQARVHYNRFAQLRPIPEAPVSE